MPAKITVSYTSDEIDVNDAKKVFKSLRTVFDHAAPSLQGQKIEEALRKLVQTKNKPLGAALFEVKDKTKVEVTHASKDKTSGEYALEIKVNGTVIATSKAWINQAKTGAPKHPLFNDAKGNEITKNGYYGGAEDEPHVHVYSGGCHLKLGAKRFNLVQDGTKYLDGVAKAHSALSSHGLKDKLAPWVAAALKYFKA